MKRPRSPAKPMTVPKRVKRPRNLPECKHGRPPPCELCHRTVALRFALFRFRCAWREFKEALKEMINGR